MGKQWSAGFSHVSRQWLEAGLEPTLVDLLADPVVHLVMRRDGVSMTELCNHVQANAGATRTDPLRRRALSLRGLS